MTATPGFVGESGASSGRVPWPGPLIKATAVSVAPGEIKRLFGAYPYTGDANFFGISTAWTTVDAPLCGINLFAGLEDNPETWLLDTYTGIAPGGLGGSRVVFIPPTKLAVTLVVGAGASGPYVFWVSLVPRLRWQGQEVVVDQPGGGPSPERR